MNGQQRAAMQAALDALEQLQGGCTDSDDGTVEAITVWCPEVIDDLRAALAQQEQAEPVAYADDAVIAGKIGEVESAAVKRVWEKMGRHEKATAAKLRHPLYTSPPPRKRLTAEVIAKLWRESAEQRKESTTAALVARFARAIERAHGIGDEHE